MPPLTAQLITNKEEFRATLRESASGWTGVRNYKVNTINIDKAMSAPGLPKMGDLWGGPDVPAALSVVERGEVELMGGVDDGTGVGGWCRVPITYETPRGFSTPTTPTKWTEIVIGKGAQKILIPFERFLSVGGNPVPINGRKIGNGEGVDVNVGICEAIVHVYRPVSVSLPLRRLLELSRPAKLNDDNLILPPLYGHGQALPLEKGQVLYMGFAFEVVGSLMHTAHTLELSENFLYNWITNDEFGNATQDPIWDRVYDFADMAGLW